VETLAVLREAWSEDPVDYQHEHSTLRQALVLPKPLGHIPIMLGSSTSPRAIERVARSANGWLPVAISPEDMGQTWSRITKMAAEHGRDAAAMKMICRANLVLLDTPVPEAGRYPFVGSMDQIVADAVATAEAGADELILEFQLQERFPVNAAQMLEQALTIRSRTLSTIKGL
jgi:alkanesulfonate monooxygenase SsuD/methylene tetrahydromethanopterin reductase-like flavin-dependent oxidoreductase (luciferase family)